jgi:arsenate reductase (thioredoxin)
VQGSDEDVMQAFREAFLLLDRRISLLLNLPFSTLEPMGIKKEIENIGTGFANMFIHRPASV